MIDQGLKVSEKHPNNRILQKDYRKSSNFYESDRIFQHLLNKELSADALSWMDGRLRELGRKAALEMDALSLEADKQGPELIKRNHLGEIINEIKFHPAYHRLTDIAVQSGMFTVKWEPGLRQRFSHQRHRLGFAPGFIFTLAENGLYCPLCMTDGVARLIDRYAEDEDKERLLKYIWTDNPAELYTGAMFLTEKAGGSDVGANLVSATHYYDKYYLLNGEKWFCSNANAEIIFALARTNPDVEGTKGLSIFLVEKQRPDGTKNEMDVVRLKEKLGVRSMASAECILTDTYGKLIGEEGQGFKIMADMINLSRLYNAISAIGITRRGLAEAYQFLKYRKTFGEIAINHPLIRQKLFELGAKYTAHFYLTWRAITALDLADNGDEREAHLLRLLTPMVKKETAAHVVYSVGESMELMGGLGYIEDGIMPKFMRDSMVLPIWEGAGNIMVLDMLRAMTKSDGLLIISEEIQAAFPKMEQQNASLAGNLLEKTMRSFEKLSNENRETTEYNAKPLFEKLSQIYAFALLHTYTDVESSTWTSPAIAWYADALGGENWEVKAPPTSETLDALIAWNI